MTTYLIGYMDMLDLRQVWQLAPVCSDCVCVSWGARGYGAVKQVALRVLRLVTQRVVTRDQAERRGSEHRASEDRVAAALMVSRQIEKDFQDLWEGKTLFITSGDTWRHLQVNECVYLSASMLFALYAAFKVLFVSLQLMSFDTQLIFNWVSVLLLYIYNTEYTNLSLDAFTLRIATFDSIRFTRLDPCLLFQLWKLKNQSICLFSCVNDNTSVIPNKYNTWHVYQAHNALINLHKMK